MRHLLNVLLHLDNNMWASRSTCIKFYDLNLNLLALVRWCAPYAYKERAQLGCGGADKWTAEPATDAFPLTHWAAGSGTIYCDPGYYCPNVTAKVPTKAQ